MPRGRLQANSEGTSIRSTLSGHTLLKIDKMIQTLTSRRRGSSSNLSVDDISSVCMRARESFMTQPMCLSVKEPVCLVGDIHGQFEDLIRIFTHNGLPPKKRYLFLGDYVDRGKNSVEVMTLLLCYKVKFPDCFYLLRGNHESEGLNMEYGFFDECKRRFTIKLFKSFVDCYNCMPVAAVVSKRIFCCHGGLSPHLANIEQINHIKRPTGIPNSGLLCDLVWADPENIFGWGTNTRGVSVTFGRNIVDNFVARNDFDLVVRAHQVVEDGYEFFAKRQLVTLFSAPNYCGVFDNSGATMYLDENLSISFCKFLPNSEPRPSFVIATVHLHVRPTLPRLFQG
ncbi:serine/threonine-protein phosphatase PP1-like [Scaptodrosophila lebanonensis]|uniref:Serine/threonine-protein phosphatase n=1 Tax=Drosophila lebanonensis TaxID=7225 RepID=A0A6J2TWM3_DROLE|nr:serine/threonine-protein phosphatase PP1-like [Scaptodrosophila lebanonensis]